MLHLSGLYRYPLKSAMGEALRETELDTLGVQGDRRWMVVDTQTGRFLTQRLLAQMTQLQARWLGSTQLQLSAPGMSDLQVVVPDEQASLRAVTIWRDSLQVPDAGDAAAQWLSEWLGRACRLVQVSEPRARQVDTAYAEAGDKVAFADGFPLLLIGQASLDDLSARVGRPLPMLRFRPNLVVSGSAAYAEDSWKRIRIGELEFRVVKGCSRCIMTTLDPQTGKRSADREPLTTLKTYRERNGEVFFGQNLIACGEGYLRLDMPVQVLE
ncbi:MULTISPECIES: MOSC domain-containing protein [Pseudomonas]|uniref:MOSC domain-containing protein n=1 Tax=Pseudomonas spirodelae TaxID=3101751 RepID=A0ABU5P8A8_9PSED|nr:MULTISPECIES: MOSC domain-containing protein [unclassified Pseudomonas]MDD2161539.1 MOSC domain-containing protein [Pseudomonas sp. MIL19]MEA1605896.1 MOSC domain-containing protein [Pseudomonas sp. T5W1]